MNNNTIQINSYLQNEMSAEERAAFENLLINDKELQYELEVQRNVINAAINAGIKAEFAKAMRHRIIIRQLIKWGIVVTLSIIILLIFLFRHSIFPTGLSSKENISQPDSLQSKPFIAPPSAALDIPFSQYSFDAAKGDTIYYPSGSIICFPANAFVDAAGNLIKGMVNINYREFADPVDFLVSGIPMDYDSAGVNYNFESSGMCEINAYQNNNAVFVNQQAKPQINLSGKNKDARHNVYFLDTVSRNWKFIGKDAITEVKKLAKIKPHNREVIYADEQGNGISDDFTSSEDFISEAPEKKINPMLNQVKPVKPLKATPGSQAFSIEIEPGSFEELFAYDRLKFEVVNDPDSKYKASDADEHWENVKLANTNTEGIYTVTFSNPKRTVSYKVRPVLDSKDYDAALKIFNEKDKAYEQALNKRIVKDKAAADSAIKMSKELEEKWNAENERIKKMNDLIILRNKQYKEIQRLQKEAFAKQLKENEEIQKKQQQIWEQQQEAAKTQQLLFEQNQLKYTQDISLSSEIIRTFTIERFGIWNCDHPQYPDREISVEAIYTDNDNNSIYLPFTSVVYKGFNGITQFPMSQSIRVIPGSENMILSIKDGLLYYFSYKDFMAAGITKYTSKVTFKMRKSAKQISSYVEIKELIDKL